MKENRKRENKGDLGWPGSVKIIGNVTIRYTYSSCAFYSAFIETKRLSCTVFEI